MTDRRGFSGERLLRVCMGCLGGGFQVHFLRVAGVLLVNPVMLDVPPAKIQVVEGR